MKTREIVHVQTIHIPPGVLPDSARVFRFVACLVIVAERNLPLQFFCRVTAAFYNDQGRAVWSRRVRLFKVTPTSWRREDIDDGTSSASTVSQGTCHSGF